MTARVEAERAIADDPNACPHPWHCGLYPCEDRPDPKGTRDE